MSEIRHTIMGSIGPLLGVAIAVVIVTLIAGMSMLSGQASGQLFSSVRYILLFLPIVGICVAISIALAALKKI